MMDEFSPSIFDGIVLDESSILKNYTGKTRTKLIDNWGKVQYRLCCSATPAPNDFMELGNHAEFLGFGTREEMLSKYFINDQDTTQKWRLKGHAESAFWQWVSSWAVVISNPRDVGCDGSKYDLPELRVHQEIIESDPEPAEGMLFPDMAVSATEVHRVSRNTTEERCAKAADIANNYDKPVVVWCESNDESKLLASLIPDSVEVRGDMPMEKKKSALELFTTGEKRVIITKPSIAGYGLNWQHCNKMVFAAVTYSYEKFYQAIRRCWRFGQTQEVDVYIIFADQQSGILESINSKAKRAEEMTKSMIETMSYSSVNGVNKPKKIDMEIKLKEMEIPQWLKTA
jgi:hypothetical protein